MFYVTIPSIYGTTRYCAIPFVSVSINQVRMRRNTGVGKHGVDCSRDPVYELYMPYFWIEKWPEDAGPARKSIYKRNAFNVLF